MIEYSVGDILRATTDAIVNPVNCLGVMGAGLALQMKHAFPENFVAYQVACKRHEVYPGYMFIYMRKGDSPPRFIINFPTKMSWGEPSYMSYIRSGMSSLAKDIARLHIKSVAIPALGCGLGGLRWEDVKPIIVATMMRLDHVHTVIYEPTPVGSQSGSKISY